MVLEIREKVMKTTNFHKLSRMKIAHVIAILRMVVGRLAFLDLRNGYVKEETAHGFARINRDGIKKFVSFVFASQGEDLGKDRFVAKKLNFNSVPRVFVSLWQKQEAVCL